MNYTKEEKRLLESNEYTAYVGDHTIKFTPAFYDEFKRRLLLAEDPKEILKSLGYDINIVGERRIEYILKVIRHSDASYASKAKRPSIDTDYTNLSSDEALKKLAVEVVYLRQEVEFLKKFHHAVQRHQSSKDYQR